MRWHLHFQDTLRVSCTLTPSISASPSLLATQTVSPKLDGKLFESKGVGSAVRILHTAEHGIGFQ